MSTNLHALSHKELTLILAALLTYFAFAVLFGWFCYQYEKEALLWYVVLLALSLVPFFEITLIPATAFVIGSLNLTYSLSLNLSTIATIGFLIFGKREHRIAVLFILLMTLSAIAAIILFFAF